MEINALLMGLTDNVATCITDIVKGDTVTYRKGNECISLTAEEDIPYCHKIALADIPEGGEITTVRRWRRKTNRFPSLKRQSQA